MANNSMNINDYNLKAKFSIVQQPNLMFITVHCYLSDFFWHCCGSLCRSRVPIASIDAFILKITHHLGVFESWVCRYTPKMGQNGKVEGTGFFKKWIWGYGTLFSSKRVSKRSSALSQMQPAGHVGQSQLLYSGPPEHCSAVDTSSSPRQLYIVMVWGCIG